MEFVGWKKQNGNKIESYFFSFTIRSIDEEKNKY